MNDKEKKQFFWAIAIGLIVFLLYAGYSHHKENTISGRISIIKNLKMSDITDVKK